MKYTNKIALRVTIPEEVFMTWLKQFAPELSSDAEMIAVIPIDERKELVVKVMTNKKHTIDYLKANGRLKAS